MEQYHYLFIGSFYDGITTVFDICKIMPFFPRNMTAIYASKLSLTPCYYLFELHPPGLLNSLKVPTPSPSPHTMQACGFVRHLVPLQL